MNPPPLSLYIHIPWCEKKCPYCDFNSYAAKHTPLETDYVSALLADLECDLPYLDGREIASVFIGGGTPSLFSGTAIALLIDGVRERVTLAADAEITLEANPGSADAEKFKAFNQSGINRLSLGVQSFDDAALRSIGRVHDASQAVDAFVAAREAGFSNINLDLMFALPRQTFALGIADIERAIELAPEHISYYQLTVEPNTPFHADPPALPRHESAWRLETYARRWLHDAGYRRYEVSAHARTGRCCRHNVNYWRFGDYLGIGSGAHAKLTTADGILRLEKHRNPNRYLSALGQRGFCARRHYVNTNEAIFEFMLNAMRLTDGFERAAFTERVGADFEQVEPRLNELQARGLIERNSDRVRTTTLGLRFLNDVQGAFQ